MSQVPAAKASSACAQQQFVNQSQLLSTNPLLFFRFSQSAPRRCSNPLLCVVSDVSDAAAPAECVRSQQQPKPDFPPPVPAPPRHSIARDHMSVAWDDDDSVAAIRPATQQPVPGPGPAAGPSKSFLSSGSVALDPVHRGWATARAHAVNQYLHPSHGAAARLAAALSAVGFTADVQRLVADYAAPSAHRLLSGNQFASPRLFPLFTPDKAYATMRWCGAVADTVTDSVTGNEASAFEFAVAVETSKSRIETHYFGTLSPVPSTNASTNASSASASVGFGFVHPQTPAPAPARVSGSGAAAGDGAATGAAAAAAMSTGGVSPLAVLSVTHYRSAHTLPAKAAKAKAGRSAPNAGSARNAGSAPNAGPPTPWPDAAPVVRVVLSLQFDPSDAAAGPRTLQLVVNPLAPTPTPTLSGQLQLQLDPPLNFAAASIAASIDHVLQPFGNATDVTQIVLPAVVWPVIHDL